MSTFQKSYSWCSYKIYLHLESPKQLDLIASLRSFGIPNHACTKRLLHYGSAVFRDKLFYSQRWMHEAGSAADHSIVLTMETHWWVLYQEHMPVQKSHISELGASSGLGKHEAAGRVLSRFWWCTEFGNVWFPHRHGILLLSHYLWETSRQPCRKRSFPHTCFLHELCLGHGVILLATDELLWSLYIIDKSSHSTHSKQAYYIPSIMDHIT